VHDSICQRLSYPDFWDPFSLDYDNHESLEDGENEEKDFVLEDISVKEEDLRKAEEILKTFYSFDALSWQTATAIGPQRIERGSYSSGSRNVRSLY